MEELLEILRDMHPDVDFETEEHLIDNGILDSLDIVSLISEISENFDVTITARDILPENFNSAQALYELIRRLERDGQLITLPDKLREVAALRLAHPEDTLAQLAQRCDPPITKSALNHRLRKLVELGREL